MNAQELGAFIAGVRKERGMTQAELARRLQVTDKAVSRWERGVGFPDINMIEPLAEALGVSILELMKCQRLEGELVQAAAAADAVHSTVTLAKEEKARELRWQLTTLLLCLAGAGLLFWGVHFWLTGTVAYLGAHPAIGYADGPTAIFVTGPTAGPVVLMLAGTLLLIAALIRTLRRKR